MAGIGHAIEARSTNFLLTIGDDRKLTWAAQNANVTEIILGSTIFSSGQKELKVPSNTMNQSPLVTDILLSEDFDEWIALYKWMLRCKNRNGSHLNETKPISLTLLTAQNKPTTTFVYEDAWPTEMSGIQYAVDTDGSTVLTTTVMFEYNRFIVETANGERIDESYTG